MSKRISPDAIAVAVLVLLWGLFFWRVLTPIDADKASFKQGDFSGQFVAFGAYQYERFMGGEVPLWNPYNNSGLPFIADTQAAVFYPPRLLTIALASVAGGWSYHALELEAIAHVLLYTLGMFALVRRMTGRVLGGLVAAIVGGYSGYLAGYPPLQLALLEAGVWLPLAVMGVHEATQDNRVRGLPLTLTGTALGLSWLAGHPQTSWFLTYLVVAYLAWRCALLGDGWRVALRRVALGTVLVGVITFGATAVTFIPGVEYLAHTARAGLGYTAKSNGFPIQDIIQFVYPGVVSLFSPLYVGVVGLLLAITALRLPFRRTGFWFVVAGAGLLLSFGGNSAFFPSLYNLLPGLRFFRGQERAAYLVANSLAILAGMGLAGLLRDEVHRGGLLFRRLLLATVMLTGAAFFFVAILWLGFREQYGEVIGPVAFAFIVAAAAYAAGVWLLSQQVKRLMAVLPLLVVLMFDLFSVNMDANSNYDDIPPAQQLSIAAPPLVQPVQPDSETDVARVDGFRGLTDNYGSLYGVYDARGISPLFLDGLYQLQQPPFATPADFETNPLFWELNAVEYVYSGRDVLPVASNVVTTGADRFGPVFLHRLDDPRPFALLVYQADVVDSDAFARSLLADPRYDPRASVIVAGVPSRTLPGDPPPGGAVEIIAFAPERIQIQVDAPENAVLSLAHPHYPGWQAHLDGNPVDLLRAYGGFTAVVVPAGEHTLALMYRPLTFIIGAVLSSITWALLGIVGIVEVAGGVRRNANDNKSGT
jgi:hypothetical protein